jgi:hypothetical protein
MRLTGALERRSYSASQSFWAISAPPLEGRKTLA